MFVLERQRMEANLWLRQSRAGAERELETEWALVSAYIGRLFLNPHPLPSSLLLHFLSRSLRKATCPNLLQARHADLEGTERAIALGGSGTGVRDIETERWERGRERRRGMCDM